MDSHGSSVDHGHSQASGVEKVSSGWHKPTHSRSSSTASSRHSRLVCTICLTYTLLNSGFFNQFLNTPKYFPYKYICEKLALRVAFGCLKPVAQHLKSVQSDSVKTKPTSLCPNKFNSYVLFMGTKCGTFKMGNALLYVTLIAFPPLFLIEH